MSEAISHTKAPIEQGNLRYDKEFLSHVKAALKAANNSYRNATASFSSSEADAKAHENEQMREGIKHLKAAIGVKKSFHIEEALPHAAEVLSHLELAPK